MRSLQLVLSYVFVALALSYSVAAQDIVTVAGGGPNNMPATTANLSGPISVAYDKGGNLYIAAEGQWRVFKVDTSGTLTVVAGNGVQGEGVFGNGGPTSQAEINDPRGVAVDSAGNVYVSEYVANTIRRIDAGTGTITQYAANNVVFAGPVGIAFDSSDNLYIASTGNHRIVKVSTSGTMTTVAGGGAGCTGQLDSAGDGCLATQAIIPDPEGVALDSAGNLFIADFSDCWVRRVDAVTQIITRVAGSTCGYSGDGGSATSASLGAVRDVKVDHSGNLIICDYGNNVVREVAGGIITTIAGNGKMLFAGDGGPAINAQLSCHGVATDSTGDVAIADSFNNRIRVVAPSQTINTAAGSGDVFYSGDGRLAVNAGMETPQFVSTDVNGNIFLSEATIDNRIRRVDVNGTITTVAGVGEVNGVASTAPAGTGGPATSANLFEPLGVVEDAAGNVYIAEAQDVRRVDAVTGIISIYAGSLTGTAGCTAPKDNFGDGCLATQAIVGPKGLAFDSSGNLLLADSGIGLIRRIDATTKIITAVAGNGTNGYSGDGGPASSAQLNNPWSVTADTAGNLFIADQGNSRIRRVDAKTGVITTVAGNGTAGFSGDGKAATSAELAHPLGVVVDSGGDLFVADTGNIRVRRVDAAAQTITTYAGDGTIDLKGDGGPANSAGLSFGAPNSIALDTCDNLLIQSGPRIRRIGDNPEAAGASSSAANLNLPSQLITTASAPLSFTVKDTGCIGLEVASVVLADTTNFSTSENCSKTTVSPNQNCNVSVTFKPTAAKLLTTTATIITNDAASPLVVPISGNGTDFNIAAASGGSASATVTAGQTASYSLQAVPINGFTGNVALACTGAPVKAVCSVSPNSTTINGAAAPFSIMVATTATVASGGINSPPGPPGGIPFLLAAVGLIGMGILAARLTGLRPRLRPAFAGLGVIVLLVSCGGGGSSPSSTTTTTVASTPKGSYTLTVSGTASGVSRNLSLTLTVN